MADNINISFGEIANALKSLADNHVLGVAADIYDESLGKYQSEINNNSEKVKQNVTTSNANYPLLLAPSGQTTTTTGQSYFDSGVTLNPSTNTIAANISGNAATATKVGASTVGSSTMPIYLSAGTPTSISSFPEAYLSWGGRNLTSNYGPIDAALVGCLGANRFDCLPAGCVTVQYTRDGSTWIDYGATNDQKINLVSQTAINPGLTVGKSNSTNGMPDSNSKLRVIINSVSGGIPKLYSTLNKFIIYCTTSGSSNCTCTIKCRTQQNYNDNVDTWTTAAENVSINGWSGYNVINLAGITTYGNQPTHIRELMFEFSIGSHSPGSANNYYGLSISKIFAFGGVGWTTPSNMAASGHLYSYDYNQNVAFPAGLTTKSYITADGALTVKGNTTLGDAASDTVSIKGPTTLDSTLTVKGNTTLGDAATDTVTIAGGVKLNGDIVINDGTNKDRFIKFQYANTDQYSWRIGYLGSGSGENNFLTFQTTGHEGGTTFSDALKFGCGTKDAYFGGKIHGDFADSQIATTTDIQNLFK